jgi:hypothetical protein
MEATSTSSRPLRAPRKRLSKSPIPLPASSPVAQDDPELTLSYLSAWHEKSNEEILKKVAEELIRWAISEPDALKIAQFYVKRGIPRSTFYHWALINESFKKALEMAKEAIGNRREIGGLMRVYDSSIVHATMPMYDDEWKRLHEWRAQTKMAANEPDGPRIIVIDRSPSTDLVPEKDE